MPEKESRSRKSAQNLLNFIQKSPTSFHAAENAAAELERQGFVRLQENREWKLAPGGEYYVMRNGSSLIAFSIPEQPFEGFQMICSHTDSPAFKIKEIPELEGSGYVRLNVEKYGGALLVPWFDRPLSAAGRLLVRTPEGISSVLVNIDRDLLIIPSLAIHLNREANNGYKYQIQKDLCPLYTQGAGKRTFLALAAEEAGVKEEALLGAELYLYNRQKGTFTGADEEFISSPRLDDLQCLFASLQGFLQAENRRSIKMFCAFDNEEVGSRSRQGAASTFLPYTLERICCGLGGGREKLMTALASSFIISADNAHAVHPAYPEKSDAQNRPRMNGGIVIKYNAYQKYTTDARSAAVLKLLCGQAGVPWQTYVNHSDAAGGSTLGNILNAQVSPYTADIGLAQLAMHSPYETAGAEDSWYLEQAAKEFYSSALVVDEKENLRLE